MKILHLGDLHIGKVVKGFSMIEDQRYILKQIIEIIASEKIEAVILAGDIYDKSLPSVDGVTLLDDFLTELSKYNIPIFMISGNHDSKERLNFGKRLMEKQNIHICSMFNGEIEAIKMEDEYGDLYIHLLPFVKPIDIRSSYKDEDIENNYHDAIKFLVDRHKIDVSKRNIFVMHQFITNSGVEPEKSDSEIKVVGGLDNIDASVFDSYDYVALGHIHKAQQIKRETIRYSGSQLKYSESECNQIKTLPIITFKEKGSIEIEKKELKALRDMRKIEGYLEDILNNAKNDENNEDYIFITLKDKEVIDAMSTIKTVYKNAMEVKFKNKRTEKESSFDRVINIESKSPEEIFEEFFEEQNGEGLNEEQRNIIKSLFEELGGNE